MAGTASSRPVNHTRQPAPTRKIVVSAWNSTLRGRKTILPTLKPGDPTGLLERAMVVLKPNTSDPTPTVHR